MHLVYILHEQRVKTANKPVIAGHRLVLRPEPSLCFS